MRRPGLPGGLFFCAAPKTAERHYRKTNGPGYSSGGGSRAKFLTKQTRICWLIYRDDFTSPRLRSSSAWAIPISLFPGAAPETGAGLLEDFSLGYGVIVGNADKRNFL